MCVCINVTLSDLVVFSFLFCLLLGWCCCRFFYLLADRLAAPLVGRRRALLQVEGQITHILGLVALVEVPQIEGVVERRRPRPRARPRR